MNSSNEKNTKILSPAEHEKLVKLIEIIEEATHLTDEVNAILRRLFDSGVRFRKNG